MPPFNERRRDRLADAAIELLAREGARGLTHRAVDAEADEPAGTTSRYFRTRDALMRGVVDRARALHFGDLARARQLPVNGRAGNGAIDGLTAIVHNALTTHRSRHLAMLELFLESVRRPELRTALTETRVAQNELIREVHRAAGITLSTQDAAGLVNAITGLIFTALTTPDAVGGDPDGSLDELIRDTLVQAQARPKPAARNTAR